jgi:hypothetical protein
LLAIRRNEEIEGWPIEHRVAGRTVRIGATMFSSTISPPMLNVTVSVPVPSPLKTWNPTAFDGVGWVTPNAGGEAFRREQTGTGLSTRSERTLEAIVI